MITKIILLVIISHVSLVSAFSPSKLVGCYQTLKVNGKEVNFRDNRSIIYQNESAIYIDENNQKINSIIFALFNKRHYSSNDSTEIWDEWSTMDLFTQIGTWSSTDEKNGYFDFEGILKSVVNHNILFNYNSSIHITNLNNNRYKIKLTYSYSSSIGFSDKWGSIFIIKRIAEDLCL